MTNRPKYMLPDTAPISRPSNPCASLTVNDQTTVEPRMALLDALCEKLALTGTKKACDRGECVLKPALEEK
jgi:hypothetical protein